MRASGFDSVRFTVRWKARRSCFRFAVSDVEGVSRIVLAWERRFLSAAFGVLSVAVGSGGESGFSSCGSSGSEGSDSSEALLLEIFALILRPASRSALSLEAPVAYRTRSGST